MCGVQGKTWTLKHVQHLFWIPNDRFNPLPINAQRKHTKTAPLSVAARLA